MILKMSPRPAIFGVHGLELSEQEKDLFDRMQPLGFILFKRNCKSPEQVKKLVKSLKESVFHDCVPILIDQEGGSVQRLFPPHWRNYPAAAVYGDIAQDDMELAQKLVDMHYTLLAQELNELGITVNCAPVLDISFPGSHRVIGERAFSDQVETATLLGGIAFEALCKNGIMPVIKHLPGHGRAKKDSHKDLPIIEASLEDLIDTDFDIFRQVVQNTQPLSAWGMTGHLMFPSIDPHEPVTTSVKVIQEIIRGHIGFKGILISDCLTMEALKGTYQTRAIKALEAGCDLVLHCNGHLEEMIEICSSLRPMSTALYQRILLEFTILTKNKEKTVQHPDLLWREFQDIIEPYWYDQLDTCNKII